MLISIMFSGYVTALIGQKVGASVPDETGPGRPYLTVAASATALGAVALAAHGAGNDIAALLVPLIALGPLLRTPPMWYRLGLAGAAIGLTPFLAPASVAGVLVLAFSACFLEGTLTKDLPRLAAQALLLPCIAAVVAIF